MYTQANSVYRYKFFGKGRITDFIFSHSQSINNLNNSYFNRDKHTGNDKPWRQTNSQEQFWEPTSEDVSLKRGPWKTIVLLPISLPASPTSQLVCSPRWAAVFLGFSPLSSHSRGRVPHFICLSYSDVRLHRRISPADGLLERRGSAWTTLSGAFTNATLRHWRYLFPNEWPK